MKTAIIIHGMPSRDEYEHYPSCSQQHWLPWIKEQLEIKGITTNVLEMPEPYRPNYQNWKAVFEQFHIDKDTILVGHSCGAGFLVRWLSEHTIRVGKVMLVAPWIDPNHEERESVSDFFDFEIDPLLSDRANSVSIFISSDDESPILKTVEILEQTLKEYVVRKFENKGHFTLGDMSTDEFPELLEEIIK